MPLNRRYTDVAELGSELALFPLEGALLLPHAEAPLMIFEPRYLAMVDDTLKGDRLIGMIQPYPQQEDGECPRLFDVGCAGRITDFSETGDGRYRLGLHGICRFRTKRELDNSTPFRRAAVDYAPFVDDLRDPMDDQNADRTALLEALRHYSERHGYAIDWNNVSRAPTYALVDALSIASPFGVREKQALLEAPSVAERAAILIALSEIESADSGVHSLQ